jgi:hypothetical protein|tara:strand:- start:202 stop:471 length:270 start_codon:yes stop_codon:yes gene_type:complete
MGISKDLIKIICKQKNKSYKKQNYPIQHVYKQMNEWNEKKSIIKNFSWRDTFKRNVKIIIIFLLEYLPFSWEVVFFSYIRGENINKINL